MRERVLHQMLLGQTVHSVIKHTQPCGVREGGGASRDMLLQICACFFRVWGKKGLQGHDYGLAGRRQKNRCCALSWLWEPGKFGKGNIMKEGGRCEKPCES